MFASVGVIGAEIAQVEERDHAMVEATSSILVFRSTTKRRFSFEKVHGLARGGLRLVLSAFSLWMSYEASHWRFLIITIFILLI